jgi:hypothetical protein
MGFFELLKFFIGVMPLIIQVVPVVEAAFPGSGLGAQKLATVLSTVQAVVLTAPAVISDGSAVAVAVKAKDVDAINVGLTHIIGAVVALFNATGAFKKSTPAA